MMEREQDHYLTWAEINLKAVRHNYREIKKLAAMQFDESLPQKRSLKKRRKYPEILAVIKADAYGHGMLQVADALNNMGVGFFGVSDLAEGIALRKNGIKKPILIFESTLPSLAKQVIDFNLTPTVCTLSLASSLNTYAKFINRIIDVHIKIDTGMGRLGVWHSEGKNFISEIMQFSNLSIKGIYTHFPMADSNAAFTKQQIKLLNELVKGLDKKADIIPYVHAANSIGLGAYKTHVFNLARPGLMLYGLYPKTTLKKKLNLIPAMSVKTRVIFLKKINKGCGISYGHTFIAHEEMTIAILPIGYNDGYSRSFSNKTDALVNGKRCPVVGRVTMDQTMIDVSNVKNVRLGTEVVLLGGQGTNAISADELADKADTINYEIICSLGNRLPRVYK